jgi:hypothetical protein
VIHYFDREGAICGESFPRNWTMNRAFVTCAACASFLANEGHGRFSGSAPRLGVKVATSSLRLR